jgi:ankyrin repeat protein
MEAYTERDLVMSCFSGLEFMVSQILQSGVNVNCNYTGNTPLSTAADYGYKEICELLIAHGADVNATNLYGESPLTLIASKGHFEICELLIQNGANINALNHRGIPALSVAAEKGNNEICELLLTHGLLTHGLDNIQNAFIRAILCEKEKYVSYS